MADYDGYMCFPKDIAKIIVDCIIDTYNGDNYRYPAFMYHVRQMYDMRISVVMFHLVNILSSSSMSRLERFVFEHHSRFPKNTVILCPAGFFASADDT